MAFYNRNTFITLSSMTQSYQMWYMQTLTRTTLYETNMIYK